tara:strand:- start:1438 stop:2220 length:783 start_codon:yes stop_codon:yes gene_type:complete
MVRGVQAKVVTEMSSVSSDLVRIAMWSGPRNISTAMMRAWENRSDSTVVDEPLYAHYLSVTGKKHPMTQEVIAAGETDWEKAVEWLTVSALDEGVGIFYQKHMAHHLLPEMGRGWMDRLTNCLLIRDPQEMITSYIVKNDIPEMEDLGIPQLVEVYDRVVERTGAPPPIIDSRDVLENPERVLGLLCEAVGVPFTDSMLAWPVGRRDSDGVWGPHWYDRVEQSTGFHGYRPKGDRVPDQLAGLLEECQACYDRLYSDRLV